jgi:NAD(P)-dependent dehydrogenase (short-subunit alcohol dehydrogenase family)
LPATTFRLDGRVAVVTGASSGIGRATAMLFAASGARVVLAARREAEGEGVAEAIRAADGEALFVRTDVADPAQVDSLIATAETTFGRVDTLVSAAGVMTTGTAAETSLETWATTIGVNLAGPFHLAKYGLPALERAGGGSVVIIASELGTVGAREAVAYCAAKGGLVNMARALAVDSAPSIRVNCLCPGPVDTPMLRDWIDAAPNPEELERTQLVPVPLGRFGQADELARAALFLASDASSFMTGAVVVSDGGATAWYGL